MRSSLHFTRVLPVLVLAGLSILVLGTMLPGVQAAPAAQGEGWLNPAWNRRMPVFITNTGSTLTNYQVHIALASPFEFSSAKPDGSDLRVTAADGTTELPFWIESWGTSSASLYVKIPSLVGSDTTPTVYLYYGNPAATSASNGSTTFDLFDDFETPFGKPLANAQSPQTTPTYTGTGNVVYPSVVYFPTGWHGYKYWFAVEPYPATTAFPGGVNRDKNPSILASNDGASWVNPYTITNPVALTTTGYLGDGDLMYDAASNQLWLYYINQSVQPQPGDFHSYVVRKTSADGSSWGNPLVPDNVLLDTSNFSARSPAVLYDGSQYRMWTMNTSDCNSVTNTLEQRTSSDGVAWSGPVSATLIQPGYRPWSVDVISVPTKSEFWALVAAYPNGSTCDATSLFFARSSDGLTWTTYSQAALVPGVGAAWDGGEIYRSTLLYDAATDNLQVWYSANTKDGSLSIWYEGYTARNYTQFLGALSSPNGNGWVIDTGNGDWAQSPAQVKRGTYSGQLVQYPSPNAANMLITKSQPLSNNFYQEWDLYDDLATPAFKIGRAGTNSGSEVGVGVYTGQSTDHYVYHTAGYGYNTTTVARTLGWHKFGILIQSDASATFYIDGVYAGNLTGQFNNATLVKFPGLAEAATTYNVDDLRVRKYASPEPVVILTNPTAVGPNALTIETFRAQSTRETVSPLLWIVALGLAGCALLLARARRVH